MSVGRQFTLCCVIDRDPRFYVELVLWAICAKRYLPSEIFRLIVYFVDAGPADLVSWLHDGNIETRQTLSVVNGSPHCNKIAPFLDETSADFTIVTDSDLFFVDDPSGFFQFPRFRAPPNNHCNPPPEIFKTILAATGLRRPYRPGIALHKGGNGMRETHINNISGGVIAAPTFQCKRFGQIWLKWANWLMANRSLMSSWAIHLDQVGFALAMEEIGEDVEFLPPQINTVLHSLGELATVYAFHLSSGHVPSFQERFNPDRTLNTSGVHENVALSIERLNECIRDAIRENLKLPSTKEHLDKFLNPQWAR
jgi:hypothetical protein